MADNYDVLLPKITTLAMKRLRNRAIMPLLVDVNIGEELKTHGQTVDVDLPGQKLGVIDVVPSNVFVNPPSYTATTTPLSLDYHRMVSMGISDVTASEQAATQAIIKKRAEERIAELAENINDKILATYKKVYTTVGTVSDVPFASTDDIAREARAILSTSNVNMGDYQNLFMVLEPFGYANAMGLDVFRNASASTDPHPIIRGMIGQKLGFNWVELSTMPIHTPGVPGGTITVNGAHLVDATTVSVANTAAGTLVEGDIITKAGDTQNYVVGADVTWSGAGNMSVAINPPLKVATSGTEAITLLGAHTVNLAMHRSAISFVSRPLQKAWDGSTANIDVVTDVEMSGLSMRTEITRQQKQTVLEIDVLCGAACLAPERIVRVIGKP